MKSVLNKIIEYLLFVVLNLFFANHWWAVLVIIYIGVLFQGPTEEHMEVFVIIWFVLLLIKLVFVEICYKKLKYIRKLLDKVYSVRWLLGIALAIDICMLIMQFLVELIAMSSVSQLVSSCKDLMLMYPFMLGGITLSYLFFALRKNHLKVKRPAKSDE